VGTWEVRDGQFFLVSIKGRVKLLGKEPWCSDSGSYPGVQETCPMRRCMPTLDPQLLSGELSHCGAPNGLGTASREPESGDQSSSTIAEQTRQGALTGATVRSSFAFDTVAFWVFTMDHAKRARTMAARDDDHHEGLARLA
jgi:hypothetical protein